MILLQSTVLFLVLFGVVMQMQLSPVVPLAVAPRVLPEIIIGPKAAKGGANATSNDEGGERRGGHGIPWHSQGGG
jgi:hypothetical protein